MSVYANDFTDGLALHAIRLVFDTVEAAVNDRAARPDAREMMHNVGTIAGMAYPSHPLSGRRPDGDDVVVSRSR